MTLTIVYTFNFIDRILISVVGRPIKAEFDLNNFEFGILSGIGFALFYTLLGIPIASLSERYNRVRIIGVCVILWSVATVLCGFATGFVTLLLARLAVGIGEAGCTPPANSIISDYYEPKARPTALGIYAIGITAGSLLAQLGGGWLIQNFTWRESFIFVGAPGIIVGILVLLSIREPARGYSDPPGTKAPEKASFREAIKEIMSKPTYWTMAAGATCAAFGGYAMINFVPLHIQYTHSIGPGPTAINYMAPIAFAGVIGAFLGGWLTEQANKFSASSASWIPGIAFLLCVPFLVLGFLADQPAIMLFFLFTAGILQYMYLGSQYNIAQAVVSLRSRATSIAILLFVVNLIGYGIGPPFIGYLGDIFINEQIASAGLADSLSASCEPRDADLSAALQSACQSAQAHGLARANIIASFILGIGGLFFLLSARTLVKDSVIKIETK